MISMHSKMTTSVVAGGAALLLAVLTPAAVPAAGIGGSCSPTKVKYLASDLINITRSSVEFANIPETAVGFTQGGASASCVIVRFSAVTSAGPDNGIIIGAKLDNATFALPDFAQYSGYADITPRAQSFEFIFPSVAPGNHIVRMQFASTTGAIVKVFKHNTVVHYK